MLEDFEDTKGVIRIRKSKNLDYQRHTSYFVDVELRLEVIFWFVSIGEIAERRCLIFLFIIQL